MFNDNHLFVYGNQNVQVPAHLNFGKYILDNIRLRSGEIALENAQTGKKMTYKEFTQYAVNMSVALKNLGVGKGDIVALGSERRNEFLPTALAIVFTGASYTPYELDTGRATLKNNINIVQPTFFICSNQFWDKYSDILISFDFIKKLLTLDDSIDSVVSFKSLVTGDVDVNRFEPMQVQGQSDVASILYSSGTTGMPKGVQVTHLNCILNSLPDDFRDASLNTAFNYGVWNHNYDTFMTYKFLVLGRKTVYMDEVTPYTFLKSVQECSVDIAFIVPSLTNFLSKVEEVDQFNLDSLKVIYSRSSPLHSKTIEKVKARFPKLKSIWQGYGITEAGEPSSECRGIKGPKPGSVGMVSPGTTLKVVDIVTRKTLGPNQNGEICLRGPTVMKGYMTLLEVDPTIYLEEGFFKTGDLGYYDDDGYIFIVGRLKELIIYDGANVAPLEMEAILQMHPGVREAGVVGKPVPDYGEVPVAFIVKQPGATVTEEELIDYVAKEVPPLKQLRGGVKFIQEMPRNPRGKIVRQQLRDMLKESL